MITNKKIEILELAKKELGKEKLKHLTIVEDKIKNKSFTSIDIFHFKRENSRDNFLGLCYLFVMGTISILLSYGILSKLTGINYKIMTEMDINIGKNIVLILLWTFSWFMIIFYLFQILNGIIEKNILKTRKTIIFKDEK